LNQLKNKNMEFVKFIFSSFWVFVGFWLIMIIPFVSIISILNDFHARKNIRDHGWPPKHCNSTGELKENKDDDY